MHFPIVSLLLFPLWPFGSFLTALFNLRNKISAFIFIAFFFLIGCSFYLSDPVFDGFRYALDFKHICLYGLFSFIEDQHFWAKPDFYDVGIMTLLSFTNSPRLLYGVFGAIYGIFVYWGLLYILQDNKSRHRFLLGMISIAVFVLCPHMNINGVRFWTATWASFAFFTLYIKYRNWKYLIPFFCVPLIHSSFYIIDLLFLIAWSFKEKITLLINIYLLAFIGGLLLPKIDIFTIFSDGFGFLYGYEGYAQSERVEEVLEIRSERSQLNIFLSNISAWFVFLYSQFLVRKRRFMLWFRNTETKILATFTLVVLSFVHLLINSIPVLHRFNVLAYMLFFALITEMIRCCVINIHDRILLYIAIPLSSLAPLYFAWELHNKLLNSCYLTDNLFSILSFALQNPFQL
ncbi:MAG: hypothetical protein ACI353_03565 [Alloprevotella sp.]